MSFTKTLTSSLTRNAHCFKDLFNRSAREKPPKLLTELVYIIIFYLFYDFKALIACSMTCRSWHHITTPYRHYYLTTSEDERDSRYNWPTPLRRSSELGVLPFVKQLCIRSTGGFTPEWLKGHNFRYFSALTNLQELGIDYLKVLSFMSDIEQYFGHLAPTLRFLALYGPQGSSRQILCFIGLFLNLQDLKICDLHDTEEKNTADTTLVPPTIPPLRGRFAFRLSTMERFVEDMITLFGGLRFRSMEVVAVKDAKLLLGACAETLETLRLDPVDIYENKEDGRWRLDLSEIKSLRTLEITARSITCAGDAAPIFFKGVFSTFPSHMPLDAVIIYNELDVGIDRGMNAHPSRSA